MRPAVQLSLLLTGGLTLYYYVKVYEKYLEAGNLARLLRPAEQEVELGKTRSAREFIKEFKSARDISD